MDRGGWGDGESRVMADIQISQETCLERGGEWVTDEHILIPPELRIRESTPPPPPES